MLLFRYKKQVEVLAAELSRHFASQVEARASGMIVNTCGWVDGEGKIVLACFACS